MDLLLLASSRLLWRTLLPLVALLLLGHAPAYSVPGDEFWDTRFGPPGVSGEVKVMVASGDNIFVAGDFQRAGNLEVNNVARWSLTQHRWFSLGDGPSFNRGVNGSVLTLVVDGNRLYVGGQFSHAGGVSSPNVATYDISGDSWSTLGGGAGGDGQAFVSAIAVKGNDVFIGGQFAVIGTLLANNVARWDGTKWNRMESAGINGKTYTMAVVGNDLYAGGEFNGAGTSGAVNLARWNGTSWSTVDAAVNGPVRTLLPVGTDLYIGGSFTSIGGIAANNIARYNTAAPTWSTFGIGVSHIDIQLTAHVNAIAMIGSDLYVGGSFRRAGGDSGIVRHIARWNGTAWSALRGPGDSDGKGVGSNNSGFAVVNTLAVSSGQLYLGGRFDNGYMRTGLPNISGDGVYDGYSAFNVVRWDPPARLWRSLGDAPNGQVNAIAIWGDAIFFGGRFTTAGGVDAMNVAVWDVKTNRWGAVGGGTGVVTTLLYAAGAVYAGVGKTVMRFSGSGGWETLGSPLNDTVRVIASNERGLYAGTSGGTSGVYSWNGSTWAPLGGGVNGSVYALAADNDGVYVGGAFTTAGGNVSANNVAHWDGSKWTAMGQGTDSIVRSIASNGSLIYVGGDFATAGGSPANHVARWSAGPKLWSAIGTGLDERVRSVAVSNGTLYAAGDFATTGSLTVRYIASFDGEVWDDLGSGTNAPVSAMVAGGVGGGSIYAVGSFDVAGITRSFHIARWSQSVASVPVQPVMASRAVIRSATPNPTSGETLIRFRLDSRCQVSLSIIDPLGREVAQLVDGERPAGEQSVTWNAQGVAAGVYYCRLQNVSVVESRKIVIRR